MSNMKISGIDADDIQKIGGISKGGVSKISGVPLTLSCDLSTFTEVDTPGRISVSNTKATVTALKRNENAYLYKDYGASYFNALSINFTFRITGHATSSIVGYLGLTVNTVGGMDTWASYDIGVRIVGTSTDPLIELDRGDHVAYDNCAIAVDTTYYCTLSRAADNATVNLYIYSDAARTNLLDTLSVSGYSTSKYRYLYAVASCYYALTAESSGWVDKITL